MKKETEKIIDETIFENNRTLNRLNKRIDFFGNQKLAIFIINDYNETLLKIKFMEEK